MTDVKLSVKTNEQSLVQADSVEYHSLFQETELIERPEQEINTQNVNTLATLRNAVSGIARFNFKGDTTHTFVFDIPVGVTPRRAVVSLALADIYNRNSANNLRYGILSYSLSYIGTAVRVTGRVRVGDSDGYLYGLSYMCIVL